MKKYIPAFMILVATSHLQASTITAEDEAAGKWTRKFKVKGGKITHTPESVVIESGGFSINSPGYSFAKKISVE